MVESGKLLGWYDYYQRPGTNSQRLSDWRGKAFRAPSTGQPTTEITDSRATELPRGSHVERLLIYTRPILEDGIIEYDFWYAAGKTHAHPALGLTCFVLKPSGVEIHHATDGRYDRTKRRPDNRTKPSTAPTEFADRSNSVLPLLPEAWNSMRLQVQGDTLRISLNDQLIHQHAIELEPNQRTFGLFHYADQSDLRVRNPSWQGEWPKALPELEQQELAVYANGFLEERSGDLTQVIQYRLDDKSLASRRFRVIEGNAISNVRPTSQGLILSRDGSDGYTGAMIAPNVRVGGDFDLTVALDQFACRAHLGKIGSTRVLVLNEQGDMALIHAAWWIGSTTKRFSA